MTGDVPRLDPRSPYLDRKITRVDGYCRIRLPVHALADKSGNVRLHRVVLYDSIGAGIAVCGLCGRSGLSWRVPQTHPDYLVTDHINGKRGDNRLRNLRPVHKWCNDNRPIVEGYRIGWERWRDVPVPERPALRIAGGPNTGAPTPAALRLVDGAPFPVPQTPLPIGADALAEDSTALAEESAPDKPKAWVEVSAALPGHLLERYPQLKGIT